MKEQPGRVIQPVAEKVKVINPEPYAYKRIGDTELKLFQNGALEVYHKGSYLYRISMIQLEEMRAAVGRAGA
jgi:hypothetical protein